MAAMFKMAAANNIRLMVSFPLFYNPAAAGCLRLVKENRIGRICLLEGTWATTPGGIVFNLCGETGTIFNSIGDRKRYQMPSSDSQTAEDLEFPHR